MSVWCMWQQHYLLLQTSFENLTLIFCNFVQSDRETMVLQLGTLLIVITAFILSTETTAILIQATALLKRWDFRECLKPTTAQPVEQHILIRENEAHLPLSPGEDN